MILEEITKRIQNYKELTDLVKSKVKVMERCNFEEYNTRRGIESMSFDNDVVEVTCDDTFRGCYDTTYFEFPISWLSKTDAELEEIITMASELKKEKEREKKEQLKRAEEEKTRQKELELYKQLKAKFG